MTANERVKTGGVISIFGLSSGDFDVEILTESNRLLPPHPEMGSYNYRLIQINWWIISEELLI